jgi:hypothetical protein
MGAEIVFEIYFGIAKWHAVLLEQRVYLEASLELKEPADLSLRQGADAIPLNGDGFERPSRDVVPSTLSAADTSSGRSIVTFFKSRERAKRRPYSRLWSISR